MKEKNKKEEQQKIRKYLKEEEMERMVKEKQRMGEKETKYRRMEETDNGKGKGG